MTRGPQNVLVTSSRMFFALDEIRKFGRQGHHVFASDTFEQAPGSHSAYVEESIITASPRYATNRFLDDLENIVRSLGIEILVPAFEEAFYIAKQRKRFDSVTHLFTADFDTLLELHDKARFLERMKELGLYTPRSIVVETAKDLEAATKEMEEFMAKPVYSRGGLDLYTNTGPLAGELELEDCEPSRKNPWLVQEFLHGQDLCSLSICHHGRIAAHATYVHPKTIDHAGGIVFESVEVPETLAIAEQIVEATGYHGQISLDFMKTDDGFALIECNPRPTAGVTVMSDEMFVNAVMNGPKGRPVVAPAGERRKISVALIRDMFLNWKEIPSDLAELVKAGKEIYLQWGDIMPGLYQFLSYAHVATYRKSLSTGEHKRSDLMAAYFFDILWDGDPIA